MYTNDFLLLDTEQQKAIYSVKTGTLSNVSDLIYDDIKNNYPDLKHQKTKDFINCLDQMSDISEIDSHPKPVSHSKLNNLLFISSENCNLKCKYCFASHGSYGNVKTKNMSYQVYMDSIKYILNHFKDGIRSICFFGGEPLINFDQIRKFVLQYNDFLLENPQLIKTQYGIITNGVLMNEDIEQFCYENDFAVTLSIDGPKYINDMARISNDGSSSYDDIFDNLSIWSKGRLKLAIEFTINNYHIQNYKTGVVSEWLNDLRKLNFNIIAMFPAITDDKDTKIDDYDKLKLILEETVDYWFKELTTTDNLSCIDGTILSAINKLINKKYSRCCSVHNSLAVNPNGEIYPCQTFCSSRDYYMGTIYSDSYDDVNEVRDMLYKHNSRKNISDCQQCWLRNICSVWCLGNSQCFNGNLHSIVDLNCFVQKVVFERVAIKLCAVTRDKELYDKFNSNLSRLREISSKLSANNI